MLPAETVVVMVTLHGPTWPLVCSVKLIHCVLSTETSNNIGFSRLVVPIQCPGIGVNVAVFVGVGVGELVGVLVGVGVGELVGVTVGVAVCVVVG